nr:teichoic acids export ABC transporter ATP-binding subunit TagH [Virgibacillus massiliensis]
MEKAIIAKNVSKKYKLYNGTKERLLDLITPKSYGENFYALTDVNFEAEKGDIIGFVGVNGSGKSTLSNILAGIVPETDGNVDISGEVALIAVSAGLKNDLTGRDNIELKLLMLGFSKNDIKKLEPEIIEFAELENFIDQPVKSYSSGMKSRLGFAISVTVDPDILIIDEALSVGDKAFAEKSLNKMKEFKKQGKTMIFVSHSIGQMKQFCEKILWLEYGKVKDFGPVKEVIPKYEAFLNKWKKMSKKEKEEYKLYRIDPLAEDTNDSDENQAIIDEHHPFENRGKFIIQPISKIGHINANRSFIYSHLSTNKQDRVPSEDYKNCVYYIKREAKFSNSVFYLLSNEPSGEKGIVGWMKANDVNSKDEVLIDSDKKRYSIMGAGQAFERPWGGKRNLVYDDLGSFRGKEFVVNRTIKIGKNLWYNGILEGNSVWIHQRFLEDIK